MPVYDEIKAKSVKGYLPDSHKKLSGSLKEYLFYIKQANECGGPILELACGAARIMMVLAEAGFETYGLDMSPYMLKIGQQAIKNWLKPETQKRIHLIRADMRNFAFKRKFPLIIIPYISFWYNLDEMGAENCLKCVIEHLDQNGKFIIDTPKVEYVEEWWKEMSVKYKFRYQLFKVYDYYKDYDSKDWGPWTRESLSILIIQKQSSN